MTLSTKNFVCDETTEAITINVIVANSSAAIKYGSFADNADQNVFDTTTWSVFTAVKNESRLSKFDSCG